MRKWTGGVLIVVLAVILLASYSLIGKSETSKKQSVYDFFNAHPNPSKEVNPDANGKSEGKAQVQSVVLKFQFKNLEGLDDLYVLSKNLTRHEFDALLVWDKMKFLFPRSDALPELAQGVKEAVTMVKDLLLTIEKEKDLKPVLDRTCPHFVTESNTTLLRNESFLEIPCGLVQDSSVTLIGIPDPRQHSFQIELIGSQIKEDAVASIALQYKVLLPGENLTKEAVTIQNTWTQESGWGKEEKCPDHGAFDHVRVDGLVKCNTQIVQKTAESSLNGSYPADRKPTNVSDESSHASTAFHFVDGNPFTATLWAGNEGFHMTMNGRHETSFAYRERLEPWEVNRVEVKGGLTVVSHVANGLPVNEDVELVADAQELKVAPFSNKGIVLLIGVFSSGNNFERRMALRRTWMQYDAVRSGEVAVRFFIGLHKNKDVNLKLWKEAQAYGDIQLMPFVDYYGLLTYKTIAICILGTKIFSAKYIMKMDDDAFVRIDEVLSSLKGKPSNELLYGRISFDSSPHREKDNKWFISAEEWARSSYPPWAHGPGYILSQDIARFIVKGHQERALMLFKLEDVAVGIWIEQFGKSGRKIEYVNEDRFNNAGCDMDYILAHYQNPRMMLCLWEKLHKQHKAECCE